MEPLAELALLLRPAGGGLHLVTSGREEQLALQLRLYRARSEEEVRARFAESLARLAGARAVILGVPSDVGAGYVRGASLGPQGLRARLLEEDPAWPDRLARAGVVDLGDVLVVPQLLHDEMLSESQLAASRRALYPQADPADAAHLPVSPLSMAERALAIVLRENPNAVPLLLGGDHSVAWPAVSALAAARPGLAVLHLDAHTDLLAERLGVRYCFATWAFHASALLGRGRVVQVGIRVSRRDRSHWEREVGVRQVWAEEVRRDPERALEAVLAALAGSGASSLYVSNDIDGTDPAFAGATGTPEPGGLHPDFVCELIRRAARLLPIAGADLVEVAPPIARTAGGAERTLSTAARYLRETLGAILGPLA